MAIKFKEPDPIVVPLIPPPGSKIVGHRESDGAPIYERKVSRVVGKRRKIGPDGKEEWIRNQVSGEAIIPREQNIREARTERFTLMDDLHGNVFIEPYIEPSPEELEQRRVRAAAEQIQAELATEAARRGLTAADLIAHIMGDSERNEPAPKTTKAKGPDPAKPFPQMFAPGRWYLDAAGTEFKGTKAKAEAKLHGG